MKDRNDIDKLLRASLDGYHPAPSAPGKDRFLEEAAGIVPGKQRPRSYWTLLTIAILLLGLTGGMAWYLVVNRGDEPQANSSESSTKIFDNRERVDAVEEGVKNENPKHNTIPDDEPVITESENINQNLTFYKENTTYHPPAPETGSSEAVPITPSDAEGEPAGAGNGEMPPGPLVSPTGPSDSITANSENTWIIPDDSDTTAGISREDTSGIVSGITGETFDPVTQDKGGKSLYGIFYKPDFLYNIEDNKKMMHSLGLEYQFRTSSPRYVARVGLGISISPGYYDYGVDYNEYMGSYLRLDSVTFNLAEDNFHLESTYHQSEVEVWDSTMQTLYLTTDKRFAYLYIPVTLGYDFLSTERFSLGLRAGPSLSVLLNKKPDDPEYDPGQDQVLQVSLLTPLRNVVNWQLAGGVNFTFFSRNNYFIEMEPSFSWYFKQLSGEGGSGKNPYGVGIRISAGILPKK